MTADHWDAVNAPLYACEQALCFGARGMPGTGPVSRLCAVRPADLVSMQTPHVLFETRHSVSSYAQTTVTALHRERMRADACAPHVRRNTRACAWRRGSLDANQRRVCRPAHMHSLPRCYRSGPSCAPPFLHAISHAAHTSSLRTDCCWLGRTLEARTGGTICPPAVHIAVCCMQHQRYQ